MSVPRVAIAAIIVGWVFIGAAFLITLTSKPSVYTLIVNHREWIVRNGVAERVLFEGTMSYAPSPTESSIDYPWQSMNQSLTINITIGPGLIDLRVSTFNITLYDADDVSNIMVTLEFDSKAITYSIRRHSSDLVTITGFIIARCLVP